MKKNILLFTGDLPYPPYGRIRMYDMVRVLGSEHRLTLFSLIKSKDQEQYVSHLMQYCEKVITFQYPNKNSIIARKLYGLWYLIKEIFFLTPRIVSYTGHSAIKSRLRELLNEKSYDIVQLEYFASYPLFLEIKKKELKVLDGTSLKFIQYRRTCQLAKGLFQKAFWYFQYIITKRHELRALQSSDLAILTTEADKNTVLKFMPDFNNILVIKNGFNVVDKTIDGIYSKAKNLFMTGSMSFYPNIDAIVYFAEEIFPIVLKKHPDCIMHVIGQNPAKKIQELHDGKKIIVTGTVKNVYEHIQKCGVCVAPLRIGSGIKGKIIEALAYQRPVVTTKIGAEGMDLEHGNQILIANNACDFANSVIALIEDQDLFYTIARKGRLFVEKHHSFEATYGKLAIFYSSC